MRAWTFGLGVDDLTIARWRLRAQGLAGDEFGSILEAVEVLTGVQAENYSQATWAVSTRTAGSTRDGFRRLFDEGEILRTHVLRPTWHFVRPADIRWLLETTAPRVLRSFQQLQRALDLDDRELARSHDIIGELLSNSTLSREALGAGMRVQGVITEGQRLGLMLMNAELRGLICSGPTQGGDQTYALLEERAPRARRLDRDEALAELAHRYFSGHGPATERDLSYWASLTLTDVRKGITGAGDRLDSFEHDGRTFLFGGESPPPTTAPSSRAHLLQMLDEYHNGYQDSRYVLDVAGIVPRGRRSNVGMVLVDSQMVGGMRRTVGPSSVRFDIDLFREITSEDRAAVETAASRYASFLELVPEAVFSPA